MASGADVVARDVGRPLLRAALLGAGAIGIEAAYWVAFLRHYRPQSDADQYLVMARNVAAGRGVADSFLQPWIHATAWRPPLYPGMLGGLFRVFGDHVAVAQVANVVLGAIVVILADRLAARIAGPRAGLVAAAVVAVSPSLLANNVVPLSEPLGLVLFLAVMLLLLDRRWVAAGVATGLLLLTRPSGPALLLAALVWLLVRDGWRAAARVGLAAALVVAPWVVRNEVQLHTPSLVTSNGFNLNATYSPEAIASGGFVDAVFDPRFAWLKPARIGEAKWDQILLRRGLKGAIDHPGAVVHIVGRNIGQLTELLPGRNIPAERADGRSLRFRSDTLPIFYLTTVLGLAGFWRHRRDPDARLLLLLAAAVVVPVALTIAVPRLRGPLDLALAMGVGLLLVPPGPADELEGTREAEAEPAAIFPK